MNRLYQFTCLPFGLRFSPRIFTKVLKPLLVYLNLPLEQQDTIFTDASKQGWGAHLNLAKIEGQWKWEKKVKAHINVLELKAAFLALQAFPPQLKHQHVQFGIDNKIAMTYVNKLGELFRSSDISSFGDLKFCSRQKPDFVSSVCSRRGKSDCRQKVKDVPGQPRMDAASSSVLDITKRSWLFRYRSLCNTCEPSVPVFVSWKPEPGAVATDAFNVKWDFQLAYSEPITTHCVLTIPVWTSRPWYPVHSVSVGRATIAFSKMTGSSETSRHQKDTPPVP